MKLQQVYLTATGAFFPGAAIDNDHIDQYIAPLNSQSERLKRRILAENGIEQRYYALDQNGRSRHSCASMAADAVRRCIGDTPLQATDLLITASSGGDVLLPGLANMVQAELRAPAMTVASHHGVCAAGISALQQAALAIEQGSHQRAVVVATEFPSRLFKRTRFAPQGYNADFDAHFLRWMLSDGAGAWQLQNRPAADGLSLQVEQIHLRAFSGEMPVCMQAGARKIGMNQTDSNRDDSREAATTAHWLDYPNLDAADADGAVLLRQDIRLLPQLFDIAIHEYSQLVRSGQIDPAGIDHFLCHYSSARFAPVVKQCLDQAKLSIPDERWYSNLRFRGNTGSASIFTMLDDFIRSRQLRAGQRLLLFIPESGRFTVAFVVLRVVESESDSESNSERPFEPTATSNAERTQSGSDNIGAALLPPHSASADQPPALARLLRELTPIWHDYRSRIWQTALVHRIVQQQLQAADYLRWMEQWIPQVREGSGWMRRAAQSLPPAYAPLAQQILQHAAEEQHDYRILFDDYCQAGGSAHLDALQRNAGGAALHAYLSQRAQEPDAIGLLGAVYIIEGTGQRIVPCLLPLLRQQLGSLGRSFRFLSYHGDNDVAHLQHWLHACDQVLAIGGQTAHDAILRDARHTAALYALQWELI